MLEIGEESRSHGPGDADWQGAGIVVNRVQLSIADGALSAEAAHRLRANLIDGIEGLREAVLDRLSNLQLVLAAAPEASVASLEGFVADSRSPRLPSPTSAAAKDVSCYFEGRACVALPTSEAGGAQRDGCRANLPSGSPSCLPPVPQSDVEATLFPSVAGPYVKVDADNAGTPRRKLEIHFVTDPQAHPAAGGDVQPAHMVRVHSDSIMFRGRSKESVPLEPLEPFGHLQPHGDPHPSPPSSLQLSQVLSRSRSRLPFAGRVFSPRFESEMSKVTTVNGRFHADTALFESERELKTIATSNSRLRRSVVTELPHPSAPLVRRIVTCHTFELFIASVIAFSATLVGVEVQWRASHIGAPVPIIFYVLQHLCSMVFIFELLLRIRAFGAREMYWRNGLGWDHFDAVVVATIVCEVAADLATLNKAGASSSLGQLRIIRMIRVTKLIRTIRVHRIIRFIAPLRTLVFSIVATLRSLFWSMILLLMMMYVVGTMITQSVVESLAEGVDAVIGDELCVYWCSLDRAMVTLFQSIAGGVSWREPLQPLMDTTLLMPAVFAAYVSVVYFAVLNVVTAVFCSRAMETTSRNAELTTTAVMVNKREYLKSLATFFRKIDKADKGAISLADFERALSDPHLCAQLHTLEMDSADAWALFRLIDTDRSGLISLDEFIQGCECLKGSAKGVQLAKMSYDHKYLTKKLMDFMSATDRRLAIITDRVHGSGERSRTPSPRAWVSEGRSWSPGDPALAPSPGEQTLARM
mmetsp:Transcript_32013/g.93559  ORF Transcript_32013/g.93559 Transcript_32013/m.93559 type:complete len:755 (+) Transcript_32013:164-2428(+)